MNEDRWKELVQQEAKRTRCQAAAGLFTCVAVLLTIVSVATGWGDAWLLGTCAGGGAVIWLFERLMHRETLRTLEDMAGLAVRAGGIEA